MLNPKLLIIAFNDGGSNSSKAGLHRIILLVSDFQFWTYLFWYVILVVVVVVVVLFLSFSLSFAGCVPLCVLFSCSSPLPSPFSHSCNAFQEVRRGRIREIGSRIEPKTFGTDVTAVCFFSNFDVALCSQAICLHDAGRTNRSVRSWRHKNSLSQCLSFGKHSLDFFANRDHHSAKPLWRVCCDASTSTGLVLQSFCRFVS